MTKRQLIVEAVNAALSVVQENGVADTNFDKVTYWQDTDTQYGKNHLDYRDTTEEYTKKNTIYDATLNIEIVAVVYGDATLSAQQSGTLALADLIGAVRSLALPNCLFNLARSHKWVETKGKTACCIELELNVHYKF